VRGLRLWLSRITQEGRSGHYIRKSDENAHKRSDEIGTDLLEFERLHKPITNKGEAVTSDTDLSVLHPGAYHMDEGYVV
jgi:hypothetical protein